VKLLPPPGPQRTRSLALLAIMLVGLVYVGWTQFKPAPTAAAGPASNSSTKDQGKITELPQALNIPALEPVPEEPKAGRNPFRYGVPPPPPAPPAPPPQPVIIPPPTPPPLPPPPPTVPLKLTGIYLMPGGQRVAYLNDTQGGVFRGIEGDIIDGRYRLLKVADRSVVVAFLDGSGQKTLTPGGV